MRIAALASLVIAVLTAPLNAQAVSRALGESFAWHVIDSDSAIISGLVLHHHLIPYEGAHVSITGLDLRAFSDDRGYFQFPAPPPGEWEVRVESIGLEPIVRRIIVPTHAAVKIVILVGGDSPICNNACAGTWCEDLGITVVDVRTGGRPHVPVVLRVGFEGTIRESVTAPDTSARAWRTIIGLGEPLQTVGWHSLEVSAEGYHPWRRDRVWLENVPWCHGQLMGREHRADPVPVNQK